MLRLNNIKYDDCKVTFFTGYPNYGVLKALSILGLALYPGVLLKSRTPGYEAILGPVVDALSYSCKHNEDRFGENLNKQCRPRMLPPQEEFSYINSSSTKTTGTGPYLLFWYVQINCF